MTDELQLALKFLTSLAVGLLLGLERQRNPVATAGLRTFALVALLGTVTALLAEQVASPWLLAAGFLITGGMIMLANLKQNDSSVDSGTTTVVATSLCYCLGALIWYGHQQPAVAVAIVATILLHFKTELHGLTTRLTPQDIGSILQFAVVSFIVLPLLPDKGYGPYESFNPRNVWLMVVLIAGVSLCGYLALRLTGNNKGIIVTGLLGGLVSSTATTLAFSRQTRSREVEPALAGSVIGLANLVVLLRLGVIVGITTPGILREIYVVLAAGGALGLAVVMPQLYRVLGSQQLTAPKLTNPTSLRVSLSFGVAYALTLLASAWLLDRIGNTGLFALSFISGLTDVDAITLSSAKLAGLGRISAQDAITTIVIAVMANMVLKVFMIIFIGGVELAKRAMPGLLGTTVGVLIGLGFFR